MTFNALMLPTLPPTSATGLKTTGNSGLPVVKSSRLGGSASGRRNFMATLNEVSQHQYPIHPDSTGKKVAADSGKITPNNVVKTGMATNDSAKQVEDTGAPASAAASPVPAAWQAFRMIQRRLFDFSMADENSLSNETQSETEDGSNSVSLDNLMGYLQSQGQGSVIGWLAGIGPFEQLQANISPEADTPYLFEQLVAKGVINQGTSDMLGTQTGFMGRWHWLISSLQDALNSPTASLGANGDELLAAFLQMQQNVVTGSGVNADTGETADKNAAGYLETTKLNEDFLVKMTISSLPGESNLSENPKLAENVQMVGAAKDASIPLWMTTEPNSEAVFETPSRKGTENSQPFKMTINAKAAAEQSANPNFISEGVTTQPAENGSSIKSAALKADSLPVAELDNKITRIEGDNKDGSFLFAQDQPPEHLKPLESTTNTLEGALRGLTSQAMDQIVHKAVLFINNDQHEVRLELKPEFLGHIRMQIVTENQQVAIKIVAEFPFVKEMLESNLNQLKAQLQAQGLAIGELEVSVAHDSYSDGDTTNADKIAKVQDIRNSTDFDNESSEKPTQSQFRGGSAIAETAIDYFA
jgi:flagellar hook-length control protein FliK